MNSFLPQVHWLVQDLRKPVIFNVSSALFLYKKIKLLYYSLLLDKWPAVSYIQQLFFLDKVDILNKSFHCKADILIISLRGKLIFNINWNILKRNAWKYFHA